MVAEAAFLVPAFATVGGFATTAAFLIDAALATAAFVAFFIVAVFAAAVAVTFAVAALRCARELPDFATAMVIPLFGFRRFAFFDVMFLEVSHKLGPSPLLPTIVASSCGSSG